MVIGNTARPGNEPGCLQSDSLCAVLDSLSSFPEQQYDGRKGRIRVESFADHHGQHRQFYRSQMLLEQIPIIASILSELPEVGTPHVRQAILVHLQHIDLPNVLPEDWDWELH